MAIEIPRIDTVVHFADEIGVAEISTFRDELILVVAEPYTTHMTIHHEGQTIITIRKDTT